jgi:hypothetical protein
VVTDIGWIWSFEFKSDEVPTFYEKSLNRYQFKSVLFRLANISILNRVRLHFGHFIRDRLICGFWFEYGCLLDHLRSDPILNFQLQKWRYLIVANIKIFWVVSQWVQGLHQSRLIKEGFRKKKQKYYGLLPWKVIVINKTSPIEIFFKK